VSEGDVDVVREFAEGGDTCCFIVLSASRGRSTGDWRPECGNGGMGVVILEGGSRKLGGPRSSSKSIRSDLGGTRGGEISSRGGGFSEDCVSSTREEEEEGKPFEPTRRVLNSQVLSRLPEWRLGHCQQR